MEREAPYSGSARSTNPVLSNYSIREEPEDITNVSTPSMLRQSNHREPRHKHIQNHRRWGPKASAPAPLDFCIGFGDAANEQTSLSSTREITIRIPSSTYAPQRVPSTYSSSPERNLNYSRPQRTPYQNPHASDGEPRSLPPRRRNSSGINTPNPQTPNLLSQAAFTANADMQSPLTASSSRPPQQQQNPP